MLIALVRVETHEVIYEASMPRVHTHRIDGGYYHCCLVGRDAPPRAQRRQKAELRDVRFFGFCFDGHRDSFDHDHGLEAGIVWNNFSGDRNPRADLAGRNSPAIARHPHHGNRNRFVHCRDAAYSAAED